MSGFSIEKKMDENDVARMLADERVRREVDCILVELALNEDINQVLPCDENSRIKGAYAHFNDAIFEHDGSARRRNKLRFAAAAIIGMLINTEWGK